MSDKNNNQLNCDIETGICEVPKSNVNQQVQALQKPVKLLYFTDPICSSCWGIEPQLRKLKQEYGQYFDIEYRMGGLLKSWDEYGGSDVNGPVSVAKHWEDASKYYQMPIDGDIWLEDPLSSSYPPSIAFKAAQLQGDKKAYLFLRRIKEMVFTEKKNITKTEFLLQAALDVGLDVQQFDIDYHHNGTELFKEDLLMAKEWGVRGFPTIYFIDEEGNQFKVYGSKPYEVFEQSLLKLLNGVVVKRNPISAMDIFSTIHTTTLQEYAVFYNCSLADANNELQKLEEEKLIEKIITKAGPIWRLK